MMKPGNNAEHATAMEIARVCRWCTKQFKARRGGSPQCFCGPRCRTAFWSALRRWGERAVATGVLIIADLRDADPAACTLHLHQERPPAVPRIASDNGGSPAALA